MLLNRRAMILGLAGSGMGLAQSAAASEQVFGGLAFGSTWRAVTDRDADMGRIRSTIETVISEVDRTMSPYRQTSDLSHFNAAQTTDWQTMPTQLCEVASAAKNISAQTDGAFDMTVGPIVSRYGFGPITGGSGSYQNINIRKTALQKTQPDLTLDLCGIAKGYALDRITSALRNLGVTNALIEIGGEVRTLGHHPNGRAWQIAIADPTLRGFRAYRIVDPGHLALATSGHSANGIHGRISTSHIIDPRSERPAQASLASVSVLAPTAMTADARATALCAAGLVSGVALAHRLNIAALFIATSPGPAREVMTAGFSDHVLA